jgi:hypothetical protein
MGDFEAREGRGGPGTTDIKFAISAPVFNYETGNVQVWSVTQKTIMKELDDISQMEDYDKDLTSIDLIISKEIQANGIPKYTVRPVPKKKGSQEHITAAWLEARVDGKNLTFKVSAEDHEFVSAIHKLVKQVDPAFSRFQDFNAYIYQTQVRLLRMQYPQLWNSKESMPF